jgi:tetratricopeptide (TPR) repeat protein
MSTGSDRSGEVGSSAAQRDRYLGGRPFADTPEDQAVFFGRDAEIESLLNRILDAQLLVLFGKSGLGKTSLLRAGVFPRLREHATLPIEVRIGQAMTMLSEQRPEALGSTLLDVVAAAAQDVAKRDASLDYTPGEGETLWEFFKTAMFWRGDALQIPVLVLDQFEEIFTLVEAPRRREIAEAIGTACGPMPASVRTRRSRRAAALSDEPPRLKFVISLREEYFGALEQLSRHIPQIFHDRFQLVPLSEEAARDAVVMPAALQAFDPKSGAAGTFSVAPFTYRKDALTDMLAVLKGKAGTVEPFQLQVVCRHVEQIVAAMQKTTARDVIITAEDIGGQCGIQKVIENYYLEQIRKLPRPQRRSARTLCEEGLLTDSGYRLMLEESQIEKDYGLNTAVLGSLVDSRLLRREQRLDSQFYELSHDSLAKPILAARPRWRLPRHYKYVAGAVLLVAIAGIVFGVAQLHATKQTENARRQAEALASFLMSDDLQDELGRAGTLDMLVRVQEKVQKHFAELDHAADRTASTRQLHAVALRNMGELTFEAGDTNGAKKQFVEARELLAGVPADAGGELDRLRAMIWDRLGRIAADQGNLTEAREFNQKGAAALAALLDRGIQTAAVKASVGDVSSDAGRILFLQGSFREALSSVEKAVGALSEAVRERPDQRRWRNLLISALRSKARILEALDEPERAGQALNQATAAADEVANLGLPDARSLYARVRVRLDMAALAPPGPTRVQSVDGAVRWALSRLETLSDADPLNMRRVRDLAVINGIVAREYVMAGRGPAEGGEAARPATGTSADGTRKGTPTPGWSTLYGRAESSLQKLVDKDPSNAAWKAQLSSVQLRYAEALWQSEPDRAQALYQSSLRMVRELVDKDRTNVLWSLMLADALSTRIGTDPALQDAQRRQALDIVADLQKRGVLPATWRDRAPGLAGSLTDTGTTP